ncbi:hypothetical protein H17ap60334_00025, partial [Thermosipho africanus H17ap60334]
PRGRLEKLLDKMGLKPIGDSEVDDQDDVFEKLKKKLISVEDALNIIKRKGGEKNE